MLTVTNLSFPYYMNDRTDEGLITSSPRRSTVVRATQGRRPSERFGVAFPRPKQSKGAKRRSAVLRRSQRLLNRVAWSNLHDESDSLGAARAFLLLLVMWILAVVARPLPESTRFKLVRSVADPPTPIDSLIASEIDRGAEAHAERMLTMRIPDDANCEGEDDGSPLLPSLRAFRLRQPATPAGV